MGLRFALEHPNVPTCANCRKWVYDEHGNIEIRNGEPLARPARIGTPCGSCPRKSPAREVETTLTDQNWKAYAYFLEVRATCGGCLEGRAKTDPLSRKLLRICDGIQREDDERKQTQAIQYAVMIAAAGRGI